MVVGRVASIFVLGLCAMGAATPPPHKPRTHVVTIERMRFDPQSLVVAPGDAIEWVNKDLVPHTATSRAGAFDSRVIQANASWKYTVRKRGTYSYTCTFHPTMTGRVRVK
jgi:plastocyanin